MDSGMETIKRESPFGLFFIAFPFLDNNGRGKGFNLTVDEQIGPVKIFYKNNIHFCLSPPKNRPPQN